VPNDWNIPQKWINYRKEITFEKLKKFEKNPNKLKNPKTSIIIPKNAQPIITRKKPKKKHNVPFHFLI
jgi:hypothetical protein